MSEVTLAKFLEFRNKQECGPSVPDAMRGTLTWMAKIGLNRPNTSDEVVLALRDQAIDE